MLRPQQNKYYFVKLEVFWAPFSARSWVSIKKMFHSLETNNPCTCSLGLLQKKLKQNNLLRNWLLSIMKTKKKLLLPLSFAPFNERYVPTITNYEYLLTTLIPVNTSAAFWQLPSNCWAGQPTLFPLCNTTFPPPQRWSVITAGLDPFGDLNEYINPVMP